MDRFSPHRRRQIETVLLGALELEGEQRAAFLDRECQDDEELRAAVDALLAADERAELFLSGDDGALAETLPAQLQGAIASAPQGRPERGLAAKRADEPHYLPGALLADRYRIVNLVGRGGMGEVYRADDLKLGQSVALKFLPRELEKNPGRLERLLNEVRLSLRVSHPNVCRVHDIGEAAGRHFISMEYVDGEDLAALLRRIGRLPRAKAVEIAQQLCAGLAAAHDRDVLHRDLKPANIMIDGRGRAKITDFGLAAVAGEIEANELAAGTPHYMAPEQRAGTAVSRRSDLYSLGLVLYELFTGRRAFDADTLEELARLQDESLPPRAASVVEGLDPAVDRVILACLAHEPAERPESAAAIAAALPGDSPLAAAVAAGETPSPGWVAAAGGDGVLPRWIAWTLLGSFVGGLVLMLHLASSTFLTRLTPLPQSPQVLAARARAVAARLGHPEPGGGDRVHYFDYNAAYLSHLATREGVDQRAEVGRGRPPAVVFRYVWSPRELVPPAATRGPLRILYRYRPGRALPPGAVSMELDPLGRLRGLEAEALAADEAPGEPGPEPDWQMLFAEAGLEAERFRRTATPVPGPVARAGAAVWEGAYPERPDVSLRVEAIWRAGRVHAFRVREPWALSTEPGRASKLAMVLSLAMVPITLLGAGYFAHRNLRRGRGDRRGAMRFALFTGTASLLAGLLGADHVLSLGERDLLLVVVALAALTFVLCWLYYVALEPYLRRYWPETLVSWVRLLDGRFRDSLVGRDLLIGSVLGMVILVLGNLRVLAALHSGDGAALSIGTLADLDSLHSGRLALGQLLHSPMHAVNAVFQYLIVLVIVRAILRHNRPAVIALFLLAFATFAFGDLRWTWLSPGLPILASIFVLLRFGVLPVITSAFVWVQLWNVPLTWDFSAWYAGQAMLSVGLFGGLAFYGFYHSLGGRPMLRDDLPDGPG